MSRYQYEPAPPSVLLRCHIGRLITFPLPDDDNGRFHGRGPSALLGIVLPRRALIPMLIVGDGHDGAC
jgi:hypothetical protein